MNKPPSNIPVFDDEYWERRAREKEFEAQQRKMKQDLEMHKQRMHERYELRSSRHLSTWMPGNTTEEQDKELFATGKITEKELLYRTEFRWHYERRQLNKQTHKPLEKKYYSPVRRVLLTTSVVSLVPYILGWFLGSTVLWVASMAFGLSCLAMAFVTKW